MPKKQSRNPFYFFMLDYKKKEEARGTVFPGGLKDVSNACSEEWQRMTPQQKGVYSARAKDSKIRDGISDIKYTSQGVPISLIEKEAKLKQEFEDNMNDYIKVTVNPSENRDNLISKKFYFIHVNYLCRVPLHNGEGDFLPIEFAVSEFTLRKGVENTYHEIIDIDVPMGYTFAAREHAEETHKIDKNRFGGQSSFLVMYNNLRRFLQPETIGEQLPPLYTTKGITEVVPGLLSRMAKAAGRSVDIFQVYSIETLFFHMCNTAVAKSEVNNPGIGFPALSLAEKEIWKDRFDRAPGIACDYHSKIDESGVHCSRSIVVRWAYIICDFCCLDLGIDMQPGNHCPLDTDVNGILRSKENAMKQIVIFPKTETEKDSMFAMEKDYRTKTSERTYREEQERRHNSQPIKIIDHSKLQNANQPKAAVMQQSAASRIKTYTDLLHKKEEARLRPPTTKSWVTMAGAAGAVPDMDDIHFPAIVGRGAGFRRNVENEFPPIGRGRGLPIGK